MLPEDALTIDEGATPDGGGFFDNLSDIIGALGDAATSIIGALRSGSGTINVSTDPTAPGSGIFGLDLTTIAIIGIAVYFFTRR